jgi:O-antigen ligase
MEARLFRALIVCTVCLEIAVFREPAPVDVAIIACLMIGLLAGKLDCTAASSVCLISLAIFSVANIVSINDAPDLDRAIWYVFVTLYLVASWFFFVGVVGHYGPLLMAPLINAYCFAGLISAFLGIAGYFHLLPYENQLLMAGRARGLFKDSNVYGPYFVPIGLIALTRMINGREAWHAKTISSIVFLAAVAAMFLCFSRACWLNFAVSLAAFVLAQLVIAKRAAAKRLHFKSGLALLIAAAVFVVGLVFAPTVRAMLDMRITATGLQKYDNVRFATQSVAWESAIQRPLGIGPGQAEVLFGLATHNLYLRILSENGWIGLLALLTFVGATMARAWSIIRLTETEWLREVNLVVLASIMGHLANSLVIDTLHWRHIWFIYALPWSHLRILEFPGRHSVRRRDLRAIPYTKPRLVEG